ncbi:MAG: hypothetical protein J6J23_06540 [Clostridia bacterium]|nr:hypothetical protein [Clostridia bacterium]
MKRKIANVTTILAYGALLASVVLAIIMLINFYKLASVDVLETTGTNIPLSVQNAINEANGNAVSLRKEYQSVIFGLIQPVCYTLFSGFVLLVTGLVLKMEPKQTQVK